VKGQPLLVLGLILSAWTIMRVNLKLPSDKQIAQSTPNFAPPEVALEPPEPIIARQLGERQRLAIVMRSPAGISAPATIISRRQQSVATVAVAAPLVPLKSIVFAQEGITAPLVVLASPEPAPPTALKEAKYLRLTGSFWLLTRRGTNTGLTSPSLGASQWGGRVLLPFASIGTQASLSASLRGSAPLRGRGDEIGVGLSLKMRAIVPIEMIAERRFAVSTQEKDRWSLLIASGFDEKRVTRSISVDGYGQAGIVGSKRGELFAGGSLSVRHDLSTSPALRTSFGIGLWGDAQKGASRVDIGPELVAKTTLGILPIKVAAQWRVRALGNAQPSSGPALVLAGDF
jgi:hypothetical protein